MAKKSGVSLIALLKGVVVALFIVKLFHLEYNTERFAAEDPSQKEGPLTFQKWWDTMVDGNLWSLLFVFVCFVFGMFAGVGLARAAPEALVDLDTPVATAWPAPGQETSPGQENPIHAGQVTVSTRTPFGKKNKRTRKR